MIHEQFRAYRATLQPDRRQLLERFQVIDVAHKVVGVGSVGTRAFIVLLQGRDQDDPLFLQVKEATTSVLEDHLPEKHLQATRRTRRARATADASRERHLPGLDEGCRGESLPLLAPATRHERLGSDRRDGAVRARLLRARSADGHSPAPTPAQEIRSQSPPISAKTTDSTSRSPTSPNTTPTRTRRTTTPSAKRSTPIAWPRLQAFRRWSLPGTQSFHGCAGEVGAGRPDISGGT